MDATRSAKSYAEGLELVKHFRGQFGILSDGRTLDLLGRLGTGPFTNSEARSLLGANRQTTWARLARMTQLGLLEKRGHTYRVSPFAKDFAAALSQTLRSLLTGAVIAADPETADIMRLAAEGVEMLYSKGRIKQEECVRYKEKLSEASSWRVFA